ARAAPELCLEVEAGPGEPTARLGRLATPLALDPVGAGARLAVHATGHLAALGAPLALGREAVVLLDVDLEPRDVELAAAGPAELRAVGPHAATRRRRPR